MKKYSKYIEVQKGNIPLILSVPHGGTIKLEEIPKRKNGITGIDKNTISFTKDLISKLHDITKLDGMPKSPYYIISKIHRSRIDFNREAADAYEPSNQIAQYLYNLYHNKIEEFIEDSVRSFEKCFLIDIHGFETDKRPKGFRDVDIIIGTNNLKSFFRNKIPKKDWDKNLRGILIKRFLESKIPIAPGHPRRREYALTGGFIIQNYGASVREETKSMQLELSDRIRILSREMREKTINIMVDVFNEQLRF